MKSYNEMIEEWRSLLGGRDKDPESQDMYAWTKSVEKTPWQKYKPKYMASFDRSWFLLKGGGVNITDIFKVALDKLNTGDKTSFNIVNANSNYESKKFHKL